MFVYSQKMVRIINNLSLLFGALMQLSVAHAEPVGSLDSAAVVEQDEQVHTATKEQSPISFEQEGHSVSNGNTGEQKKEVSTLPPEELPNPGSSFDQVSNSSPEKHPSQSELSSSPNATKTEPFSDIKTENNAIHPEAKQPLKEPNENPQHSPLAHDSQDSQKMNTLTALSEPQSPPQPEKLPNEDGEKKVENSADPSVKDEKKSEDTKAPSAKDEKTPEKVASAAQEPKPVLSSEDEQSAAEILAQLRDSAPEIKKIVDRGFIRIGMCTIDQPPFHVKGRNGEFIGFDVDLARSIAAELGVKIEMVEGADWDKLVTLLLKGDIDMILSNLSLTPVRATKILCSKPYAKIRQCLLINRVLLARASGQGLITLRQIFSEYVQRDLLIQDGTAYVSSATGMFPKAHIMTTESWDAIMDKIMGREVFGTISDEIEIKKRMRMVQTMELLPVVLKGKYDLMVIGVSREAPQLLHFVNTFIDSNNVECNVEDF